MTSRQLPPSGTSPQGLMSAVVRTDLSPRAQRILVAAQRVLARDGSKGLTLRAIAEEALETKSLVLYHFGSMANLEALLVDSLWHNIDTEFVDGLGRLPRRAGPRIDALVRFHAGIAAVPGLYEMYFDLLPSVIQNTAVRANVARIYEAYRHDIGDRCLEGCGLPAEDVRPLSSLLLGAGEGVPLCMLLAPTHMDGEAVFVLLAELVKSWAGLAVSGRGAIGTADQNVVSAPARSAEQNPGRGLAEPARSILRAGERLVRTGGLRGLTLDAIAESSGEPRSSVSYYFQNKQGLIEALLASVLHRCLVAYEALIGGLPGQPPSPDEVQRRLFSRASPVLTFLLMLPAVLRDDGLRQRASVFLDMLQYSLAERIAALHNSLPSSQYMSLAGLAIASVNGLAIQTLYDPVGFSPAPSMRILESLLMPSHDVKGHRTVDGGK
jgi:AcrR family transcriptional regulator